MNDQTKEAKMENAKRNQVIGEQDIQRIIKDALGSVKIQIEWGIGMIPFLACAEMLEKIFPQHYHTFSSAGTCYVSMKCKTIDEVTPILRYITIAHDLHQSKPKEQDGLSAKWEFKRKGIEGYDPVSLSLSVDFSGGKCRMEKVGEETKTIPVYEMRCDDGAAEVATENPTPVEKASDPDYPF